MNCVPDHEAPPGTDEESEEKRKEREEKRKEREETHKEQHRQYVHGLVGHIVATNNNNKMRGFMMDKMPIFACDLEPDVLKSRDLAIHMRGHLAKTYSKKEQKQEEKRRVKEAEERQVEEAKRRNPAGLEKQQDAEQCVRRPEPPLEKQQDAEQCVIRPEPPYGMKWVTWYWYNLRYGESGIRIILVWHPRFNMTGVLYDTPLLAVGCVESKGAKGDSTCADVLLRGVKKHDCCNDWSVGKEKTGVKSFMVASDNKHGHTMIAACAESAHVAYVEPGMCVQDQGDLPNGARNFKMRAQVAWSAWKAVVGCVPDLDTSPRTALQKVKKEGGDMTVPFEVYLMIGGPLEGTAKKVAEYADFGRAMREDITGALNVLGLKGVAEDAQLYVDTGSECSYTPSPNAIVVMFAPNFAVQLTVCESTVPEGNMQKGYNGKLHEIMNAGCLLYTPCPDGWVRSNRKGSVDQAGDMARSDVAAQMLDVAHYAMRLHNAGPPESRESPDTTAMRCYLWVMHMAHNLCISRLWPYASCREPQLQHGQRRRARNPKSRRTTPARVDSVDSGARVDSVDSVDSGASGASGASGRFEKQAPMVDEVMDELRWDEFMQEAGWQPSHYEVPPDAVDAILNATPDATDMSNIHHMHEDTLSGKRKRSDVPSSDIDAEGAADGVAAEQAAATREGLAAEQAEPEQAEAEQAEPERLAAEQAEAEQADNSADDNPGIIVDLNDLSCVNDA